MLVESLGLSVKSDVLLGTLYIDSVNHRHVGSGISTFSLNQQGMVWSVAHSGLLLIGYQYSAIYTGNITQHPCFWVILTFMYIYIYCIYN